MPHSSYGECDVDPNEQTRLRILISLLAEHIKLGQAAMLMARNPPALTPRFRAAISLPSKSGPHFRKPLN